MKTDLLDLRNCDCMELMAEFPDKHFDLAIVDPPYGIGAGGKSFAVRGKSKDYHKENDWDNEIPPPKYFEELFRVSKNVILWGANYMTPHLPGSMGWIFWDKLNGSFSMSDGELAFSSFQKALRIFKHNLASEQSARIHPTQKPVKLYEWLLRNYAKPGDKILDTHLGSMSIAIACHYAGHHLTGSELDADYFKAGCERVDRETRQQTLFAS